MNFQNTEMEWKMEKVARFRMANGWLNEHIKSKEAKPNMYGLKRLTHHRIYLSESTLRYAYGLWDMVYEWHHERGAKELIWLVFFWKEDTKQ